MGKKNKKVNAPLSDKPIGISTKRSQNTAPKKAVLPTDDTVKPKRKLSTGKLVVMITAAIVAVVLITGGIIWAVDSYQSDENFDYLKANLSKYVEFSSEDYKNYSLNIDIARPHVKRDDGTGVSDVEVAILSMIASDMPESAIDGAMKRSLSIAPGDAIYVWYRCYILNDQGKEVEISSNFSNDLDKVTSDTNKIIVGSNDFPPGIEVGLIGKRAEDYREFKKTTEGTVTADHVVYLNYTRVLADVEGASKTTRVGLRLDLSDPDIYEIWGEMLVGQQIGDGNVMSFELTIDGKKYNYTDTTVAFVTDFENDEENGPLVIEGYYPYDYTYTYLRNETVYYELYIQGTVAYNEWHKTNSGTYDLSYDWNDGYVTKKVAEANSPITMDELLAYEGDTLTDKYESYAVEYLDDAYDEALRAKIESAMWTRYHELAKIKRYPGVKVDAVYQQYLDDVEYQYDIQGGMIEDELTGEEKIAESYDEFAIHYLKLQYQENPDWKGTLYAMSESLVAERLIFYYIMDEEGLKPSDEVFERRLAEIKEEYVNEYLDQYLAYQNKTKDDIEDWDKFVEERKAELFDFYDDDFFAETTYYEIVLDTLVTYPTISTLDDRRAYPATK